MKKQFAKLSKSEQEKVEKEYHQMRPDEFDQLMTRTKQHLPAKTPQKRKNGVGEKKRAA